MPFAVRTLNPNSSFTIKTLNGGIIQLATASIPFCSTGLIIISESDRHFLFSSTVSGNLQLSPLDSKCLLVVNSAPTTIHVTLDFSNGADYLFSCKTINNCEALTGTVNLTFVTDADHPLLFRMKITEQGVHREADFKISSAVEQKKYVYFGDNEFEKFTPLPTPDIGTIWVTGVGTPYLIALIVLAVVFLIGFAVVARRYHWLSQCCGVDCDRAKRSQALPPSAFVGKRTGYNFNP
jgi:hypothetical protein